MDGRVVRRGLPRALQLGEPLLVAALALDQRAAKIRARVGEIGCQLERAAGVGERAVDVALPVLRQGGAVQIAGLLSGVPRYGSPSTSRSISVRSNARAVCVRTLPCPAIASDTRAIVSSSGASAMTT